MLKILQGNLIRLHFRRQMRLMNTTAKNLENPIPMNDSGNGNTNKDSMDIEHASKPFLTYSDDENQRILRIINETDIDNLLSYDISQVRAKKLLSWKSKYGPLSSVSDILLIEGFGFKVTKKFYDSLLENSTTIAPKKEKRVRVAPIVTPNIDPEQISTIQSCSAVRVGVNSITWARLELPQSNSMNLTCTLTDWHHHEVVEKKLHLYDLVQRCLYLNHLIPEADSYLFENPQLTLVSHNPGSSEQQNINVRKAQMISILGYALASRGAYKLNESLETTSPNSTPNNVFYLRRFLASRLFGNIVGSERVSSEQTILEMMGINGDNIVRSSESAATNRCNVDFSETFIESFHKAQRHQREFMGQALLLNLAFVRLALLQDSASIAQISRSANSNKNTVLTSE